MLRRPTTAASRARPGRIAARTRRRADRPPLRATTPAASRSPAARRSTRWRGARDGEQRQQAHHRPHPQSAGTLPSDAHEHVVEEAVVVVPEAASCEPKRRYRFSDGEEVLEELGRDVVPSRSRSDSSTDMRSRARQKNAIQLVRVGLLQAIPRSAVARTGRRSRCCPSRGSRPRTGWTRRRPCG